MSKNENLWAIAREIRKSAESLSPWKRREVINKINRICFLMKDAEVGEPEPDPSEQGEHFESQAKAVLDWFQQGKTLTSLEALKRFGIISFPRRVLDVEKLTGVAPKRRRIQVVNRAGKTVYVNEYWMETEA